MKTPILGLALLVAAPTYAQTDGAKRSIILRADEGPVFQPWEYPARVAYTRNGDGTHNTLIDLYLQYTFNGPARADPGNDKGAVTQANWSAGAFMHRDNDSGAPRNDRGVALSYGRSIIPDFKNELAVMTMNVNLLATFGKTLEGVKDNAGLDTFVDRDKDRQIASLSGYFQPGVSGPAPRTAGEPVKVNFFNWQAGLYSDHSSGGNGKGNGRLSGSLLRVWWNYALLNGLPIEKIILGYGVTPTITLLAQRQKDGWASGGRPKDTYKLYSASLTLDFATMSTTGTKLTPSFNLSRSVGADLLTGRAYEGKTEFSFGLKF